ncbi:DsrE family protein [Selenomonadales bacterium OttesenSCG-928-I06]|nr:DsrE family protein [Selenomonadales bacterium OttesenSCG-928-I06]
MEEKKTLHILWTNSDLHTSQYMVFMYATNSMLKNWWDNVTVIIWGATAKLVAENEIIQERIKIAKHAGVKFSACISCATQLGVLDEIKAQDIEVVAWGPLLTEILQNNQKLITI